MTYEEAVKYLLTLGSELAAPRQPASACGVPGRVAKFDLHNITVLAERLETASQQVGIEFISLSKMQFDAMVLGLLPETMMLQHQVIPVAFCNNRLTLAMTNPALQCCSEFIRLGHRDNSIIQDRINSDGISGMLIAPKHLSLRNLHVRTFLRRL